MYRAVVLFLQSIWAVALLTWTVFRAAWCSERATVNPPKPHEETTLELLEALDAPALGFWHQDDDGDWIWSAADETASVWIGLDGQNELRCLLAAPTGDYEKFDAFALIALDIVALANGTRDTTKSN